MRREFTTNADFWTGPHIRYAVTVALLAVLGALGWLNVPLYWLCFICLSYRWNTHYLLYTLLFKYDPTPEVKQMSAPQAQQHTSARCSPCKRIRPTHCGLFVLALTLRSATTTLSGTSSGTAWAGWRRWAW